MTRAEKEKLVAEMTDAFKERAAIVVCDYKGLTVAEIKSIRIMAEESKSKIKVVKNKLAAIALANAGQEPVAFVDTNLVIWSDDQIAACKIAEKSATDFKDKFVIKSALLEGKVVDAKTVNAMAKLPGRDELLGMLLNVWNAPVQNFTIGLSALAKKLEEEA